MLSIRIRLLTLMLIQLGCYQNTMRTNSLKPTDYKPPYFSMENLYFYKESLSKIDSNHKELEVIVTHAKTNIDTSLFLLIFASDKLIYCDKYFNRLNCSLPIDFFSKPHRYNIRLVDIEKEICYIWSCDGTDFIPLGAKRAYFKLNEEYSPIREITVSYN